jgi:hypothetical protein
MYLQAGASGKGLERAVASLAIRSLDAYSAERVSFIPTWLATKPSRS